MDVNDVPNHTIIEQYSNSTSFVYIWEKIDDDFYLIEVLGKGGYSDVGDCAGGGLANDAYWRCIDHGVRIGW